jgi:hypothetical protein
MAMVEVVGAFFSVVIRIIVWCHVFPTPWSCHVRECMCVCIRERERERKREKERE